jgi:hypothetical protein
MRRDRLLRRLSADWGCGREVLAGVPGVVDVLRGLVEDPVIPLPMNVQQWGVHAWGPGETIVRSN